MSEPVTAAELADVLRKLTYAWLDSGSFSELSWLSSLLGVSERILARYDAQQAEESTDHTEQSALEIKREAVCVAKAWKSLSYIDAPKEPHSQEWSDFALQVRCLIEALEKHGALSSYKAQIGGSNV